MKTQRAFNYLANKMSCFLCCECFKRKDQCELAWEDEEDDWRVCKTCDEEQKKLEPLLQKWAEEADAAEDEEDEEEDDVEAYVCYDCCRYTNQTRAEREQYDPLCKKCYEKREEEDEEDE